MSTITSLNISNKPLAPTDADGAIIVRGLHMNTVIDRVNEIAALYLSTPVVNQVKVTDYNYRGATSSAIIRLEDLKEVINKLNSISTPPSVVPLSFQLVKNTNFRTPNDSVVVRKLHLNLLVEKINVIIDKINLTPVQFKVEYDGITQFDFKFKAPALSTLNIYDGDGTMTPVAGQDDTLVTHTTSYNEAGTYYFYIEGDYVDMTEINIQSHEFVSGDISRWSELIALTYITCRSTSVSGDISSWSALTSLTDVFCWNTLVSGDVSGWSALTSLVILSCFNSLVSGDVSGWSVLTSLDTLYCHQTNVSGDVSGWSTLSVATKIYCGDTFVTFDSVQLWSFTGLLNMPSINNVGATPIMVDNILKSCVNLIGCTIDLSGSNEVRTSDSDAAFAIVDANNTLTVN